MNADEIGAAVRQLVMFAGGTALTAGTITGSQLAAIAGGAAALASIGWTLYSNWNTRRVHETAVVTATAPTVAAAKAESIPAGK